jgi:hypothetical protein
MSEIIQNFLLRLKPDLAALSVFNFFHRDPLRDLSLVRGVQNPRRFLTSNGGYRKLKSLQVARRHCLCPYPFRAKVWK